MQGGGLAENAIVPLNLSQGGAMDFVLTGSWSQKSLKEAGKYGIARVAATAQADGFTACQRRPLGRSALTAAMCTFAATKPSTAWSSTNCRTSSLGCDAPLVVDFSSHVASRPVDWSRVGLAFGGAQKNLGPAGLTLVIVREDLIGHALPHCPSAFDYKLVNDNQSMYNTPPTYSIYIAGWSFQWLKKQGGIAAMEQRNIAKAQLLYDFLDSSSLFENRVAKDCRSRMNVPFFLRDESRNDAFPGRRQSRQLAAAQGPQICGRHARQHLQRHAPRRRAGAGDLHARI
jgi:phosphoserine aminotransferase